MMRNCDGCKQMRNDRDYDVDDELDEAEHRQRSIGSRAILTRPSGGTIQPTRNFFVHLSSLGSAIQEGQYITVEGLHAEVHLKAARNAIELFSATAHLGLTLRKSCRLEVAGLEYDWETHLDADYPLRAAFRRSVCDVAICCGG